MFTGLIEEIGLVERIEPRPAGRRVWIAAPRVLEDVRRGDSIAVDGCCLTAVEIDGRTFAADVVPETLARTTLGSWREGDGVNLERPLKLDERLGGHLVQGHVDGVAEVVRVEDEGDGKRITFALPEPLARFVAEKGSITIDGTSLTVAAASGAGVEVAFVPHTLAHTVAGRYAPSRRVNVEVDLVARYVARLLEESGVRGGPR